MSSSTAATPARTAFRAWDTTSVLRPAKLACPDCRRRSEQTSWLEPCRVGDVEFHHCRACGGAWFYEKDLEAALRATGARAWPARTAIPAARDGSAWSCPCCGGALVNVRDRRREGVAVRRCLVCYGSWIEQPALERAAALSSSIFSRLGFALRGMWPG